MTKRVMVIAAHPDDETLGCGGALLGHIEDGCSVHWVIATSPVDGFDDAWKKRRVQEIQRVAEAYPMNSVDELGFAAAALEDVAKGRLIEELRAPVMRVRPDIVYLVHGGDVHGDHRVLFDAAIAVFKPFRIGWPHAIYSFECASSTNLASPLTPNAFVAQRYRDISAHIERKLEILSIYESEIPPAPHPRSLDAVRALARYRGTTASLDYAEAFMLVREVC